MQWASGRTLHGLVGHSVGYRGHSLGHSMGHPIGYIIISSSTTGVSCPVGRTSHGTFLGLVRQVVWCKIKMMLPHYIVCPYYGMGCPTGSPRHLTRCLMRCPWEVHGMPAISYGLSRGIPRHMLLQRVTRCSNTLLACRAIYLTQKLIFTKLKV